MSGPHTETLIQADSCLDAWEHHTLRPQDATPNGNTDEEPIATVYTEPNADRIVAAWNALHGLSLDQIGRLGRLLDKYNADEVEDMLRDEDL